MDGRAVKALGYVRVSTADQGESGAGLEAQRAAIDNEADRRLWELVDVHQDVASGASMDKRPELARALARLKADEADHLIVARLDRLARSTDDTLKIVKLATEQGWGLVPLDYPALDTSSPMGELVLTIMAAINQFERQLGAQRTREGLAAKRAQGVILGRPRILDPTLEARILDRYEQMGDTFNGIARRLNAEGVPTPTGKKWGHGNVRSIIRSRERERPAVAGRESVSPDD
jgi:DNA invertase Pin-like site-specific DNA recombinase